MGLEFRLAVVLLIAVTTMDNLKAFADPSVKWSFQSYNVIPDVLSEAPKNTAVVIYPSGVRVNLGNELTPTQVKNVPFVVYKAAPEYFYTLAFVDPDVPSRAEPVLREWKQWLVVNIPGNYIASGETIAEYVGAAPPNGTGVHRYVFLVYQQPDLLQFDEPRLNNTSAYKRTMFSIAKFAEKYRLGDPIAGNFFQAQYDDYVPLLNEQLGI